MFSRIPLKECRTRFRAMAIDGGVPQAMVAQATVTKSGLPPTSTPTMTAGWGSRRGMGLIFVFFIALPLAVNLFTNAEGVGEGLADDVVLARPEDERLHFGDIRPVAGEAVLGKVRLHDLADDQYMAAQVEEMDGFASQVYRALLDERGRLQIAVEHFETAVLDLVRLRPGDEAAVIGLFHQVAGGDVHREGHVLVDPLEAVAVGLQTDSHARRVAGYHAGPGHLGEGRLAPDGRPPPGGGGGGG